MFFLIGPISEYVGEAHSKGSWEEGPWDQEGARGNKIDMGEA